LDSSWFTKFTEISFYNLFYCFACCFNGVAWLKSGMVDKFFGWWEEALNWFYNCTNACFKNLFEIGRGLSNRALDLQKTKHHDSWRRSGCLLLRN
jgi:hypothetical protein